MRRGLGSLVLAAGLAVAGCDKKPGESTAPGGGEKVAAVPPAPGTPGGPKLEGNVGTAPTFDLGKGQPSMPSTGYQRDDPNIPYVPPKNADFRARDERQPTSQPVAPDPKAPPPDGKLLYTRACASCHGPDGSGQQMRAFLPTIGDLTSSEVHGRLNDEAIAALIVQGRGKMPPFASVLEPDQVKAIIGYVRTLKK